MKNLKIFTLFIVLFFNSFSVVFAQNQIGGDIGSIQKNIKSEFEKWNRKDEFEKEADYAKRLQTQSRTAFDSICLYNIKSKINSFNTYYWTKELSIYDSENESFTVYFKTNGIEWSSKINIPISQARNFKSTWSYLEIKIDNYNWCFVENSLCPTLITLNNERIGNSKYEFPLTLQNQSEIQYYFDDLGIDNSYLQGYVFKFPREKIEQIEKEKRERMIAEKQREVEIIPFPDIKAEPPGGMAALQRWLAENLSYPQDAAKENIQGTVIVEFVVKADGSIDNVQVIKKVHPSLDDEAVRVVKQMDKWKPGKINNIAVSSYFQLPIQFKKQQ